MSKRDERLAAAREHAYSLLPEGEIPRGFVIGTHKLSMGMYFLIGAFSSLTGDNNRPFGVAFSDQTAVFVGYHKGKLNYEAVKTIIRPIAELHLKKKMMSHHLVLTNDKGKKSTIEIVNGGYNKMDFPIFVETLGL